MPLIKCRECQKEISSRAMTCPECGERTKYGLTTIRMFLLGILFLSLPYILNQCSAQISQLRAMAKTFSG
jgi:hypothetical protein